MADRPGTMDYPRLAEELSKALLPHLRGNVAKAASVAGPARITSDDCVEFGFSCGGQDFKFTKAGKDSWVETVKHSHRTQRPISVGHDDAVKNPDGSFVPRDIHDA